MTMFVVSSRHTEQGIRKIAAQRGLKLPAPTPPPAPRPDPEILAWQRRTRLASERERREQRELLERELMAQAIAKYRVLTILPKPESSGYIHSFEAIMRRATRIFGVSRADIRGPLRSGNVIVARQFVMYWCRRLTALSLPQIGRLMGDRDHTTVLHGTRTYRVKRARMGRNLPAAR